MTLATWLLSMIGPVMARFILAMGFSAVTIVGTSALLDQLKGMVMTNLSALPAKASQLAGLYGIGDCLGIWLGAASFVVSWRLISQSWTFFKASS